MELKTNDQDNNTHDHQRIDKIRREVKAELEKEKNWQIKEDGSLNYNGLEAISRPINGDDLVEEIRKITEITKEKGFGVSTRCGFHVHIDARDLTEQQIRNAYIIYSIFQNDLLKMVPASRRNNSYCKKIDQGEQVEKDIENIEYFKSGKMKNSERYYILNLQAYRKHKTLEDS